MFRKKAQNPLTKEKIGIYSKTISNFADIVNVELMNQERFERQYNAHFSIDESTIKTVGKNKFNTSQQVVNNGDFGYVNFDWRTDKDRGSYINPETAGQKLFAKMNYYEEYKTNYQLESDVRVFIKKKAQCTESVVFEKQINHVKGRSEVCFSKQERSKNAYDGGYNISRPELVHQDELEAIIQIITEWRD